MGTTVCVDVVEREDEDEDAVGEKERGVEGIDGGGVLGFEASSFICCSATLNPWVA